MDIEGRWREPEKCLLSDRIKGDLYIDTEYRVEARCVKGVIEGRSDDIIVIHSHHDAVNRERYRMPAACRSY